MGTCRAEDFFDQQPVASNNPYITTINSYLPKTPEEQEAFHLLTMLQENSNFLTVPGGVLLGGAGALLSPANLEFKAKLSDVYTRYKSGELSKNQYDYRRRKILKSLTDNFGPFEKKLFKGKSAAQSLRIARKGGIPATANIAQHAARLSKLARYASKGGVVLTGVGVVAGCMQIGSAQTRKEKNEILVETATSTGTGLVLGAIVTAVMISNPVSWGIALIVATGTAAASWGAGTALRSGYSYIYDKHGIKTDLVDISGIDNICR